MCETLDDPQPRITRTRYYVLMYWTDSDEIAAYTTDKETVLRKVDYLLDQDVAMINLYAMDDLEPSYAVNLDTLLVYPTDS